MPSKTEDKKKPSKKKSREYLEAALEHARKLLPGWQYAVIHRAAMPSSGGRARQNRRLTAMEKAWLTSEISGDAIVAMTDAEIDSACQSLSRLSDDYARKGFSVGNAETNHGLLVIERATRGIKTPATIEEQLTHMAKTGEHPDIPESLWEVVEVKDGGHVLCKLDEMEEWSAEVLMNDAKLELAPGDIVQVDEMGSIQKHSTSSSPNTVDEVRAQAEYRNELKAATKTVDFVGPDSAKLVFVSACPSALELARGEALTGPGGAMFQSRYLEPLGLKKSDVAVGFSIPVRSDASEGEISLWSAHLLKALERFPAARFVALGRVAKQALGPDRLDFSMPHPAAVRRHGDRGEIDRKVKAIAKALDMGAPNIKTDSSSNDDPSHGDSGATLADSISELSKGQGLRVPVTKATDEKQIVYGVILDPYQVDLHGDWLPPAEIESTAHDFLEKSRIIGLRHKTVADASIVESWVEIYPSEKDRQLALENLPHKVFKRKFGNDIIHSGAWVAGVKLSDKLWASFKAGDLDAFSIGGFSFKTKVAAAAMPDIEFVDLTK